MAATYTVKQVAKILGYSTNSIYTFLKEERIKGVRVGRGRFRIPVAEVNRLLLVNKSKGSPSELVTVSNLSTSKTQVARSIDLPSLFDWFLGGMAILLGASMFLFSRSFDEFAGDIYRIWVPTLLLVLIAGGLGLIYADASGRARTWWHTVFRLILMASFLGIAFVQSQNGDLDGVFIFGSLTAVVALDTLFHFKSVTAVTIAVLALAAVGPLTILIAPNGAHTRAFLELFPIGHVLLGTMLFIFDAVMGALMVWGLVRERRLYWGVMVVASLIFGATSLWYAQLLYWSQVLYFLCLGLTCFYLPLWQSLKFNHEADRKLAFAGFGAIIALFILAIGTLVVIQSNLKDYASLVLSDKVSYGRLFLEDTLATATETINRFASNQSLYADVVKGSKDEVLDDIRDVMSGATMLRRILVIDPKGSTVALYPYDRDLAATDFSQRDYVIAATTTKKVYVSKIFSSVAIDRANVIVIAAPILDKSGEVKGVVAGSLDLVKLQQNMHQAASDILGEYFILVDSGGRFIFHPDKSLIRQAAPTDELALKGLTLPPESAPQTEVGFGVNHQLVLASYARVGSGSWGLAVETPMTKVLSVTKTSSIFIAILVAMGLAVGGLYAVSRWHVKRQREDTS